MKVVIDSRESSIIPLIMVPYETDNLLCGDFLLEEDDIRLLVERKTIQDLHSSIIDGRYREQRSRLLEWRNDCHHHKIMYIIEGNDDDDNKLRTMLHRLMIGYNVPVHLTNDMKGTVKWIEWIYSLPSLSVLFQTRDLTQDRVENIRFSKHMKKENILNPKTILISLLNCIHGVSYPMAAAIAEPFQSVEDFVHNKDRLHTSEFFYETNGKNKKKVSVKMIDKIIGFIFDP